MFPAALLFRRSSPSCPGLFFPDSSFSNCITKVLDVRKQEFEQLEEQKKQRCSFLRLCRGIEDMIKGTSCGIGSRASFVVLEWGDAS